jgi:thioredoxin-related protein
MLKDWILRMPTKKFLLALIVLLLLALAGSLSVSRASDADLPVAYDLQNDARQAGREHLPLLIFFSAKSCHYCEDMRELFLAPMVARGDYAGKVIMREVQVESGLALRDFDGRKVSHADFAQRRGIFLTPQIRFLDPSGKELVPGLVGLSTPELFGGYLEEAIAAALARMRVTGP